MVNMMCGVQPSSLSWGGVGRLLEGFEGFGGVLEHLGAYLPVSILAEALCPQALCGVSDAVITICGISLSPQIIHGFLQSAKE